MWWLFAFAILVVVLVGRAVLPRRARRARKGFPWLVAPVGWSMYMPLADSDGTVQFLGNEQFWQIRAIYVGRWVLPIAAAAAAGLSVCAWQCDRI